MLDEIRVLDLSDERGQLCGMMLADLGADVVCIEPPGGSSARRLAPFASDASDGQDVEGSLFWWSYARNKRSAVLDLEAEGEGEREKLRALALRADVLIESASPGALTELGLGHADLSVLNPGLITVSITPFGQDGPKAHWPASDLTVLAAGGPLWLTGDAGRPPTRVCVPQAFHHAACEAATAALIALHERRHSGRGQHVDVSAQQAVTIATQSDILAARVNPGNRGFSRSGGGSTSGTTVLRFVYPAADGYVSITHVFGSAVGPVTRRMMECVCADGFCDEATRDKDWVSYGGQLSSGEEPNEEWERIKLCVEAWTSSKTKAELLTLAMERNLLIAPIQTTRDCLESAQLASRDYFDEWERPDGRGSVKAPGAWVKFSRTPLRTARRAPRLGEHTEEVLAALDSLPPATPSISTGGNDLPLRGIKILDFTWAVAGPSTTRILADYGATVVRIESGKRVDVARTLRPMVAGAETENAALFHNCNIGKRMITLDITRPESRGVLVDLVRWADVVCESFAPGKMKKLGLDYASLCEIKPDVITFSSSLMGQTGPLARFAGYGNLGAALGGFFELGGWPDSAPAGPYGAYTDYMAPRFGASAILAALAHHQRTGEGQQIDMAQIESGLHFMAPAMLALATRGEVLTRAGNADAILAPHGCYPVEGEDCWIAIAVDGDKPWRALCGVLDADSWTTDARFSDASARRAHADDLDEKIANRTRVRKGEELEAALTTRGVPAHRVLDSPGLCEDQQLCFRGHFVERESGALRIVVEDSRSRLSRTPARVGESIPTLGADTQWVLSELLGYDDERIAQLAIAGALE
jgi:crotonobetainyl-CoA:carnitine CoA-transferase CaiB-like acyl-CoA transferase